MQLIEVNSKKQFKQFLDVPDVIFKNVPNYIRVLDKDMHSVFSDKNPLQKRGGKYMCWILTDENGNLQGRIAAFVNPKYKNDIPVGGCGFFDCIDDQHAANTLFDAARNWLQGHGMEAMDGPINYGERDRFWGLLIDGFQPPIYNMNYAMPYYRNLFDTYGFQVYFNQYCYGMQVSDAVNEGFIRSHERLSKDPKYSVSRVNKKDLDKYASDFCDVYNEAWVSHGGGKTMDLRQGKKIFQSMKPILDTNLVFFAYYDKRPIGFWINIPDINTIMKRFDGKFGWFQKIKFMILLKSGACTRAVGIIFGIVPEYQGRGVDGYMITEGAKVIKSKTKYIDYELQWIGDFNPKMIGVAKGLGANVTRELATFRYLFDRNAPFERHKILRF